MSVFHRAGAPGGALVLTLGLLAGCGGGGGGSAGGGSSIPAASMAALDTSNQTVASQDVASTTLSLYNSAQVALGAVGSSESALYATAFSHLDQLPAYMADAVGQATANGLVQAAAYGCSVSGTYSVSVTDADNSSSVSTGDVLAISFSNCNAGSGAVNGSLSFHIDALSGTFGAAPSTVSVTLTFGNLGISGSTYSGAINGGITVSGSRTGSNAFSQVISTNSLSVTATYAGLTRSRTLSSFSASETRVANAFYGYLSSYTFAGTLTSTGFYGTRAMTFSTPSTIIRRGTDFYPYTGMLLISGASNTALRLTALSNTLVQQDLDANGDGIFESSNLVGWNTLL